MKNRKKRATVGRKNNLAAYLFLAPWLIGLLIFVVYPLVYTGILSLNQVVRDVTGWRSTFIGLSNFETAFFRNTVFNPLLLEFVMMELTYVPTILILSFILSMLLNTNIRFRSGFRLIYFFPVVVLSGPVMTQLMSTNSTQLIDVENIIIFRMIESYSRDLANVLANIFANFAMILWFTGIPIILFMNGLQKINTQLYEAAQIDGANSWQILWKITIPNIKSTALVVTVFTIVQIAIFEVNPIYAFIISTISENYSSGLGFAAAIVLVFSIIVLIFVGIAFAIFRDRDKVVYEESVQEKQARNIAKLKKLQEKNNESVKDYLTKLKDKAKRIFKTKEETTDEKH